MWGFSTTFLLLWLVNKITPLRMTREDELLGADYSEHNIRPPAAVRDVASPSSSASALSRSVEDSQISQRSARFTQSDDGSKMTSGGAFRIHFTDDTTPSTLTAGSLPATTTTGGGGERLRTTPVRNNPAYQHDDEFS